MGKILAIIYQSLSRTSLQMATHDMNLFPKSMGDLRGAPSLHRQLAECYGLSIAAMPSGTLMCDLIRL